MPDSPWTVEEVRASLLHRLDETRGSVRGALNERSRFARALQTIEAALSADPPRADVALSRLADVREIVAALLAKMESPRG